MADLGYANGGPTWEWAAVCSPTDTVEFFQIMERESNMSVSSSSWNLTSLMSIYSNLLHGPLINQLSFDYFINFTHSLTDLMQFVHY